MELCQLYFPSPSSSNYKLLTAGLHHCDSLSLTTMVRTSCSGTEVLTFPSMKFSLPVLTNTENLLKLDLVVAALTFLPEVLTSPVLALSWCGAAGWRK